MARYVLPPRQKMINLLYILFIAMLSINTVSEAQRKETERNEQQLKELIETNKDLARQVEEKKEEHLITNNENQAIDTKPSQDSTAKLLVDDRTMNLAADGQLEKPVVIVASTVGNLLYSNYRNQLAVTTIGVKADEVQMEMQNGTVQRNGKRWIALPNEGATNAKLNISYRKAGNTQQIGEYKFQVKPLPTPTPYICYAKGSGVYKGNVPVKRSTLLAATEVGASIAEPQMECKVVSFETILIKENGKQLSTIHANGSHFTLEQKEQIIQLEEGDGFYITSIMVVGADGQKRQTPPINVIVIK